MFNSITPTAKNELSKESHDSGPGRSQLHQHIITKELMLPSPLNRQRN